MPSEYVREVTVWKSLDMLKHEVLTNETDSTVESNRTNQLDSSTQNKDESAEVNMDTVGKGSIISPSPNIVYGMSGGLSSQKVNNEPQINSEVKTDNLQAAAVMEGPVPSETVPEMPEVISDGSIENTTEQFEKQEELVDEVQSVDDYNNNDDDDYDEEDEEADVTDETSSPKNELTVENLSKDGMNIDNTVPDTNSVEKTNYKENDLKHTPVTLVDIVKENTVKPQNIVSESNSDINQNNHDSVLQSDMGIKDKKNEGQHSHDVNEGLNDTPVETAQANEFFASLKDDSTEKVDESGSASQKDENMHGHLSSDLDKPPAENHMKLENENLGTSFVSENVVPTSSSSYSFSDSSSSIQSSGSSSSIQSMKATDFDTAHEGSLVKEANKITSDDKILPPSESQFVQQQKVQDYTQYVDFTSYQDTLGITAQPSVPGTTPVQSDTTSVPVPDHETEKLAVNSETPHISATTTIGNDFHSQSYMNTPPTHVMKESNPYANENAETIIPETPIPTPQNPVEVTPLPQTHEYAPKIPAYPPVVDILKGTPHEPIEVPAKIEPAPTTPVPQSDEPVNLSENENVETKNNGFFSTVLSWVGFGPKPEEEPINQQSDPSDYQLPQIVAPPTLDLNVQAGLGECRLLVVLNMIFI